MLASFLTAKVVEGKEDRRGKERKVEKGWWFYTLEKRKN